MPVRFVRPVCLLLVALSLVADLLTPQAFVVAIFLGAPIALSNLVLDARFTARLVWLAEGANAVAGYANGLAVHHWDPVAVGDRVISALSFLLVGGLCIASQRTSRQAGELAAREARAGRERAVRRAVEAIRGSVNAELIARAIVREAPAALDVDLAVFVAFPGGRDEPLGFRRRRGGEVEATRERPPAASLSFALRVADERTMRTVDPDGAVGRIVLDELGVRAAAARAVVEHESVFGVLIVARDAAPIDPSIDEALRPYAEQCGIALAQATLFTQLAERNGDLAAANAALRDRGDIIRDLVYALSHDLRTPLAAAGMTMRQALAGAYGPLTAPLTTILERTLLSNDELQRLAETLVLVSRYEAGEASPRREPQDLATIAGSAVSELQSLWEGKSLRVAIEADAETIVTGDPGELRRAVVNLLANAIAFTPAGRRIVLRVERDAPNGRLIVDDDGYGVPLAQRGRLFERLGADSSRHGAGTGLGLYIVRRIAEAHGGTAGYEPKAEGSRFTLALPLADLPAAVRAAR